MGYFNDEWVSEFIKGQTIKSIKSKESFTYLIFKSGEMLRMYPYESEGNLTIIVTPFKANGEVKQTIEIMKDNLEYS